jgi:hypothetical protein
MRDGVSISDSCSVTVVRAVLLTVSSGQLLEQRAPEDLPPMPEGFEVVRSDDEGLPCELCRKRD